MVGCLLLQVAFWQWLRPSRLVGDEVEYLRPVRRIGADGPVGGAPWVRVPLHGWLMRTLTQGVMRGVDRGRDKGRAVPGRMLTSACAALAVWVAVGWLAQHASPTIALAALVLLCLSAERAVLALHLWPDAAIGLCWSLFAVALIAPDGPDAITLAVVGAVALGLRIEGAVLCGIAVVAPLVGPSPDPAGAGVAAVIVAASVALWMAMNRWFAGTWRLDTTTAFNLTVFRLDAARPDASIRQGMKAALRVHGPSGETAPPRPELRRALPRLAARLRLLLGPETFVTERLLARNAPGYTASERLQTLGLWRGNLRYGFTALAILAGVGLPLAPLPLIVLTLLSVCIYSALLTRSRYRMAIMPLLAMAGGAGWSRAMSDGTLLGLMPGAAGVLVLAVLLARAPVLSELED